MCRSSAGRKEGKGRAPTLGSSMGKAWGRGQPAADGLVGSEALVGWGTWLLPEGPWEPGRDSCTEGREGPLASEVTRGGRGG